MRSTNTSEEHAQTQTKMIKFCVYCISVAHTERYPLYHMQYQIYNTLTSHRDHIYENYLCVERSLIRIHTTCIVYNINVSSLNQGKLAGFMQHEQCTRNLYYSYHCYLSLIKRKRNTS